MKNKPDTLKVNSQFGNYKLTSNFANGKATVIKQLEIFSGSYQSEQYAEFYKFIQSVKTIDRMKIIIKTLN